MSETPFDFAEWLKDSRVAQTSVDVLQRPDLLAEVEEWKRRMDRASKTAPQDRSIGEVDPLDELRREGAALLDQLKESRATFYLAAVSPEDDAAIEQAHPLPTPPVTFRDRLPVLPDRPTDNQAKAFLEAWEVWKMAKDLFVDQHADQLGPWQQETEGVVRRRGAERLARSIISMKTRDGAHRLQLTGDDLIAMEKTLGRPQMDRLTEALDRISTSITIEPEVSPGFLSRN